MRKSSEFDTILDECLERLLVRGETIEQCLQRFPGFANELKPLLETALALNQASALQPRPEFRERARYQFYTALQETVFKRRHSALFWRSGWATIATIVLALLLASGSTVAAASGSMPDEVFYPVKLATEQAQLLLTPSALGKAEFYAKLADKRVVEIARMAGKSKPEHIERTAQRLDVYLAKITILSSLSSTQEVTSSEEMLPASRETMTVEEEKEVVIKGRPTVPDRPRGSLGRGIKTDRRAKLKEMMGQHASNHPARLRALLKTAPPSARPALLRAIAISETGYQKALKSLD